MEFACLGERQFDNIGALIAHTAEHPRRFELFATKTALSRHQTEQSHMIGSSLEVGDEMFACPQSPRRRFSTGSGLKRHIATRAPSVCPFCLHKSFNSCDALWQHNSEVHTITPAHCTLCNADMFQSTGALGSHVFNRHQPLGSLLDCPFCTQNFRNKTVFISHMRCHHAPCPQFLQVFDNSAARVDHQSNKGHCACEEHYLGFRSFPLLAEHQREQHSHLQPQVGEQLLQDLGLYCDERYVTESQEIVTVESSSRLD